MIITEILYFIIFITIINLLTGSKKSNILGCGLVGFSGAIGTTFNSSLIKILLWHNSQTRGKHATGIFTPTMGIIKDAKEAKDFFKLEVAKQFKTGDTSLLAHVRHATVGNSGDPLSAHPWDFGDIVMMHNGTLKNHEEIARDYNFKKEDWTVDSQVLGMALQEDFKENAFKVLSEYNGAAAVILYHKKRDSLFVYRDTERPLFYGYLDEKETSMYMSSLEDILEVAGCTNIKQFEPFKVHEIKNGKIITKMPVKRKKATWNKFVVNVVKSIKDIINYSRYTVNKVTLSKPNFTGFEYGLMKSKYLDGYHVRLKVDVAVNSTIGKFTKNKFYKAIKFVDDNKITVTDDSNQIKEVFITMFDISNFIPIAGGYVICLTTSTNNNIQKGKIYEVLQHTFGSDELVLRDHENDSNHMGSLINFRVATVEEIDDYFKGVADCNCSVSTKVISLPARTESSTTVINDLPFDSTDFAVVETIEDAEIVEDDKDDAVSPGDILNILMVNQSTALEIAKEASNELKESYYREGTVAIYNRIVKLDTFLDKCTQDDSTFVLNLNENSFKNLELQK